MKDWTKDDSKEAQDSHETMGDDELIAILRAEEADATSYYTSELASDQSDAMDRYFAAPYGNEIDNRSQVRTHDIEDTINWIMPDIMRTFKPGEMISCTPNAADDEDHVDDAADYLEHVFFVDNPGASIIHDFAFDGLLQRLGVISVMWEDPRPRIPQILEGVSVEQLMKLDADPEYEILEQKRTDNGAVEEPEAAPQTDEMTGQAPPMPPMTPMGGQPPQMPGQPDAALSPTWTLKVKRTPKCGRVKIENIPPEEIALSRQARAFPSQNRGTSQSASYVRRRQERYLRDVAKEFPDFKDELTTDALRVNEQAIESDPRVQTRFQSEAVSVGRNASNDEGRKKCELLTEYLWIDFDNDGTTELRRILRVGNIILENLAVEDCEFKTWSPIRVAHRAIGRSVADTIIDLQKIRTTIMRLMLDGMSQALVPRAYINTNVIDEEGIDDYLDAEVGGVVRGRGNAGEAISMLTSADLSAPAMQALEYVDQDIERRSGVSRHAQGIAPDAITKTASGIEMLQAAAGDRTEMVARWLGLALEDVLKRALQLIVAHQDAPRWVKIKGRPLDVDPRTWSDEMGVSVHVGQASASQQQQLLNLSAIAQKQEQAIATGGAQNPVCGVDHLIHTYSRMTEGMGFRDSSKFWNPPEQAKQMVEQEAAKGPAPDPKVAIAQAAAQAKAEAAQAAAQQKEQTDAAMLQLKQATAEREAAMKHWQLEQEAALKKRQQDAEGALAVRQQEFEANLAMRQQQFEERMALVEASHGQALAEKNQQHAANIATQKLHTKDGSGVRFGGEIG